MPNAITPSNLAPMGPFPTRPPPYIEQEFLDWVRDTGRPDEWRYHEKSQPPRDKDFVELKSFQVPENKRADVGMATCPICSPRAPKYFEGKLTWYPSEGVLRAIGHECAKAHFGVDIANRAAAERKHREHVESAQYFLLDTLPRIAPLRDEVEALQTVAGHIDRHRQFMWGVLTKVACLGVARHGAGGVLNVEEHRAINAVDAYGQDTVRVQSAVVATHEVSGMTFLSRRYLVSGLAKGCAQALAKVVAADADQALEFIVNNLKVDAYLFEAERLARTAVDEVDNLHQAIHEAKTFFSPSNLLSLSRWSADARAGAPFQLEYEVRYPARLRMRRRGKSWKVMTIAPDLLS